jgi:hypothetical protein
MEMAKKRIFDPMGLGATNFKVYPGSNRDVTPEQVAEEINKVLSQVQAGDFDEVELD